MKALFIAYLSVAGITLLGFLPYIMTFTAGALVSWGILPLQQLSVTSADLLGFGLLLLIPLCAITAIFGVVTAIITFTKWRTVTKRYRVFAIVALVFGAICAFVALAPIIATTARISELDKQERREVEAAYITYEEAKDRVLACEVRGMTAISFANKPSALDTYYLRLNMNDGTATAVATFATLRFEHFDAILAAIKEANTYCTPSITYWPGSLRFVKEASESQRQPL